MPSQKVFPIIALNHFLQHFQFNLLHYFVTSVKFNLVNFDLLDPAKYILAMFVTLKP